LVVAVLLVLVLVLAVMAQTVFLAPLLQLAVD
jgi:hypothetical protein